MASDPMTLTRAEPYASAIVNGIAGWYTSEDLPPKELVGQRLIVVAGPGSVWAHAPFELVPDLHPGCIVGAVTLAERVPVVAPGEAIAATSFVMPTEDGGLAWSRGSIADGTWEYTPMADQRPWADWSPGRWAWRFENPKPTTQECPLDCVRFDGKVPGWMMGSSWSWVPCPACNGDGSCSPIPYSASEGLAEFDPGRLR